MSSILRALKKLENEPRHLEETPSLENKFVPLADTRQHKLSKGILITILSGSIICGLVFGVGWWLFSGKKTEPPVAVQQTAKQNIQNTAVPPAATEKIDMRQKSGPVPGPAVLPKPAGSSAAKVVSSQTPSTIPEPTPVTVPQPSFIAVQQGDPMPIAEQPVKTSGRSSDTQDESVETISAEKIVAPEISAQKAVKIAIPALKDSAINLQAITWSKDPQKRIAVINNSILRQGENVGGYRIDTINQDDIILTEKGRKWKLLFRIR